MKKSLKQSEYKFYFTYMWTTWKYIKAHFYINVLAQMNI